jgi:hypothetical protein
VAKLGNTKHLLVYAKRQHHSHTFAGVIISFVKSKMCASILAPEWDPGSSVKEMSSDWSSQSAVMKWTLTAIYVFMVDEVHPSNVRDTFPGAD